MKIVELRTLDKWVVSRRYRILIKSICQNLKYSSKMRCMNRERKMDNRPIKIFIISHLREIQIKCTINYYYAPVSLAHIKNTGKILCWLWKRFSHALQLGLLSGFHTGKQYGCFSINSESNFHISQNFHLWVLIPMKEKHSFKMYNHSSWYNSWDM